MRSECYARVECASAILDAGREVTSGSGCLIAQNNGLASMEAKEEWDELESKWESFSARARLDDTSEDVGVALGVLGEELKRGYARIKAALTAK